MPMAIRLLSAGKVSYALTENLEVFNDLNIFLVFVYFFLLVKQVL